MEKKFGDFETHRHTVNIRPPSSGPATTSDATVRPPGADPSSLPPHLGHYRIESELSRGGMGVVYVAQDTRLHRQVALKVLPDRLAHDPQALERFKREAQLLAAMNHHNIATIFSLEDIDGIRFLTMELIEGTDLRRRLDIGALSIDEVLSISRQIAAALQAAHQKGIVHRDLKPPNVMLAAEDRVKVLDFGIAADLKSLAGGGRETLAGTPGYMSPEQLSGGPVDLRTDIWAFGCVLFACLCGSTPFAGPTIRDIVEATLTREPDWTRMPSPTPPAFHELIRSCLHKNVEDRPRTIADIRRSIEELVASRSAGFARASASERASPGKNNLPIQLAAFIGREKQRREVRDLLSRHRLLTLTGFGGNGKTRLAIEVARDLLGENPEGVWLVELASLTQAELVPQAVLSALGMRADPNRTPVEDLINSWREKKVLLVLDNCEHLLTGAAMLAKGLLVALPDLRILATSREALGVPGEVLYPVPPMSLPSSGRTPGPEDLRDVESVELFLDRARGVQPGFAITPDNAPAVAEICRRLDGIALAIELAAARVKVLSPAAIAERLESRFQLLRGGDRTALPHHQTLRAMVDWSYDQLDEGSRAVLRRLSVFAGGWTLDAAEMVCAGAQVEEWEVLDHLFRLAERSCVEVDADGAAKTGQTRYRMLETVREYAKDRLAEAGEENATRARHRDWWLRFVEDATGGPAGRIPEALFPRLDIEHDNLRAALDTCMREENDGTIGLRLAIRLASFWQAHGHYGEGLRWLKAVLAKDVTGEPTPHRGTALHYAGNMALSLSDYEAARSYYEESGAIADRLGNRGRKARSLGNLASIAQYQGDLERAKEIFIQIYAAFRELGERHDEIIALINIGSVERDLGNYPEAVSRLEQAAQQTRELGDLTLEAYAIHNLGTALFGMGRFLEAKSCHERSLPIFRQLGSEDLVANDLMGLGGVHVALGNLEAATSFLREAVALLQRFGKTRNVGPALRALTRLALARANMERAVCLQGANSAIRESLGIRPSSNAAYDRELEELRSRMGNAAFEEAWKRGRAMDWEAALEYGLGSDG